ncbi:MAG: segregation/condensation protein A [Candidatus Micrarchaeia archaeon]|jgi:segregation and condensation protein A
MDLLTIVVQPTWREFLVDLIQTNQMDPWDIDLSQVADIYLKRVRELQSLDLRVPANVILASALLLHFKADALSLEDEPQEEAVEEIAPLLNEEIPPLVFRPNLPRQRRVTLEELLNAVDQVMKKGARPQQLKAAPMPLNIMLPKETLHERIIAIYQKALALKDAENILLFSSLFESPAQKNAEQVVFTLVPVLHLVQEQRAIVWQDQLFGEIFIKLLDKEAEATAELGASAEAEAQAA